MITNGLEKNEKNTKTSIFKLKILYAIYRIKVKKKRPDIGSIYDYLSRLEASNIYKVSIELILNELTKQNVLVNKDMSLRDSLRRINTSLYLVNTLHTDSCSNNELTITESVNTMESTEYSINPC